MQIIFKIEIENIWTNEFWFSFKYSISVNGKHKKTETIESTHSWGIKHEDFRKELNNGWAAKLAMENYSLLIE